MSRYPCRAVMSGVVLLLAASTAHAQTPRSGSTTSAVEQLGLDDPAPPPTIFAGQMRELRCRGKQGIDLRVEHDPSARNPNQVAMALRYEKHKMTVSVGYEGMGTVEYGATNALLPGTCSWNPLFSKEIPPEPGVVYFDLARDAQTWAAPGSRDTTIDAAVNYPDVASMSRYLNDPDKMWIFYVDDVTAISISYRAWGTVPPSPAGSSPETDHSFTTSRDHRTSDAGTLTPSGPAGTVQDASPERDGTERPTTISVTPDPPDSAASPAPPADTTSAAPRKPDSGGAASAQDARTRRQVRLASGIRDVRAAPGPRGVRLSFHTEKRERVRVQFSKEPPRWNGRERRWEYPAGSSPWFAGVERAFTTSSYVAVPPQKLDPGARYHYLITVLGAEASSPASQRAGAFTARVVP